MKSVAGKYLRSFAGVFAVILIFNWGCKKAYNPKIVSSTNNYLVVEAVINTGTDSSIIKLSRTVPVSSATSSIPETGATVTIISDANITYPVVEKGNGVYMGAPINAASPAKYMLKITTRNGSSYQSDLVQAINSPPIDSIYYRIEGIGVNLYNDTHGPANNSRYYRWDFNETYMITAFYQSYGMVVHDPKDTILDRPYSQQIYQCWVTDTSTSIIINSSAKLADNVISHNLLTSIASTSEKLERRYSILVSQYALTPEAYHYYQQLKKNTESLGTVFDPQPSELPGNMHCTGNPQEIVIGYITAGTPTKSRIYIDSRNHPYWVPNTPYGNCAIDSVLYKTSSGFQVNSDIYTGLEDPILPIPDPSNRYGPPIGWTAAAPICVDCTLRGTNKQPSWWDTGYN